MRAAGLLAFAAVLVSGILRSVLQLQPQPWSAYGYIDLAQLLYRSPIFRSHWPYWTFAFEYQPVVGWGSALFSYVAGELIVLLLAWLVVVALCASVVGRLLARRVGPRRAIVYWSLAPQLVLFGGANFDAVAVLSVTFAAAVVAERPIRAGIAVAIGAATKLFPLVAVPPAFITLRRAGTGRMAWSFVAATAITLLSLDLPAIVAPYSLLRYGVSPYSVPTWNVDSIWFPVAVLLDLVARPQVADAVISGLSFAGLTVTYVLLVIRGAFREGADAERLIWLGVAVLVFWTPLRSPQYAIWLLPIFALYVPDVRLLAFMLLGDAASSFLVFGLRGAPRGLLGPEAVPFYVALAGAVVLRQVAVLCLILRARPGR